MSLLLAALLVAPQVYTSTAEVRACQPLSDGRVLAATTGGLVLYGPDLDVERIWTAHDGLPGTDVRALALAKDGASVWAGGPDGVVAVRRDGWSVTPFASVRSVRALHLDGDRLLVGAAGGMVVIDTREGQEPRRYDLPDSSRGGPSPFVTSLAVAPGAVHVGTSGRGLFLWDGSRLVPAPAHGPSPYVHALAAGGSRVLAATVGGVVDAARSTSLSTRQVRALMRGDGGWLMGTMGEGLIALDDRTGAERPVALPARDVTALGREGDTLCAGTTDGTFVRHGDGPWRHARAGGPPSNDVTAVASDGERMWVGTFDRGLALLERGTWRTVEGLDDRVNALAVERHPNGTRLWVATARGLATVEQGIVRVRRVADGLPGDDVHAVSTLRGGGVIVGTSRGAAIVRGGRVEALAKSGAPGEATWAVAEGADGSLWLGTTNGLYRHRPGTPVRRFSVAGGELTDNWVTSILVDGASVWVGTYAGGVSRVTPGLRTVSAEPRAPRVHVNPAGLSIASGRLWAATMEGLMDRPLDGDDAAWRVDPNAAPGPDVTAVLADGEALWVASRNGLARRPRTP
jgi:ligand-binding sensor domain-containing protein